MTEKQLLEAIIDLATRLGWRHYHTYDSRRSDTGFPDLVLARDTRLVFAELKTDAATPTRAQSQWIEALDTAGAEAYVLRPADWHSGRIEDALKQRRYGVPEGLVA